MNARTPARTRSVSAKTRFVPAYAANGRRLRRYSVEAIERLLAMTPPAVVVHRNKRTGRITSAQFFPPQLDSHAIDKTPLRKTAHMGQHYSFESHVEIGSALKAWRFAEFLMPESHDLSRAEIESALQRIFRAVPLSCLVVTK